MVFGKVIRDSGFEIPVGNGKVNIQFLRDETAKPASRNSNLKKIENQRQKPLISHLILYFCKKFNICTGH